MENIVSTSACTKSKELSLLQKILSKLVQWRHNYRSRRQLKDLPLHILRDIGLDAEQARDESGRPFWDD
ncbi:DUF1127 domain-containing protein [Vibrio ostreicida]|uniref:DUF1127 domain-containing protein n=1 Tax=Vibrio ostreicida TaxID=526588 RepID=A0ABT8BXP1_9VIBR|nr:DUF1127 domain-containing protein [Vibrio ostreicida]MDN3610865.1 DUF1127 domain-containing protein [Vibrio ostreicida]NPD10959.1 DUF1127 domain-containing protein [Vibrio ostreicida]